jgi:hypothetical protein
MTTQTVTYAELAARLGITEDSAKRLVRRRKWPRKTGNDGKMRIDIPVDRLNLTPDSPGDTPPVSPGGSPRDDSAVTIARLEAEISGLKALVEAERARADATAADRDRWHDLAMRPWWRRLAG